MSAFVSIVCISGYWITEKVNAFNALAVNSDVTFWTEITGSDKDGFDLFAKNPGSEDMKCTASVGLAMKDGSGISFEYSSTVRANTDKMSFGGEAGLKQGAITKIEILHSECKKAS